MDIDPVLVSFIKQTTTNLLLNNVTQNNKPLCFNYYLNSEHNGNLLQWYNIHSLDSNSMKEIYEIFQNVSNTIIVFCFVQKKLDPILFQFN